MGGCVETQIVIEKGSGGKRQKGGASRPVGVVEIGERRVLAMVRLLNMVTRATKRATGGPGGPPPRNWGRQGKRVRLGFLLRCVCCGCLFRVEWIGVELASTRERRVFRAIVVKLVVDSHERRTESSSVFAASSGYWGSGLWLGYDRGRSGVRRGPRVEGEARGRLPRAQNGAICVVLVNNDGP